MTPFLDTQQLVNSSVAGIAAGLIVALVLGVYQLLHAHLKRKHQIHYVSEMVANGITRIQDANSDTERLLYYNRLLRTLDAYLNAADASSKISYAEKDVLRTALPYSIAGTVAYIDDPADLRPNGGAFFADAIEQFKSIPWLIF